MAVEIGQLVLRGTFGPNRSEPAVPQTKLEDELHELRRELRAEMRDMIEDAARRRRER